MSELVRCGLRLGSIIKEDLGKIQDANWILVLNNTQSGFIIGISEMVDR